MRLSDGQPVSRQVLAVAPRMVARAGVLAGLGLRPGARINADLVAEETRQAAATRRGTP